MIGYTYYPSRYYAIAIPAYIIMVFIIAGIMPQWIMIRYWW